MSEKSAPSQRIGVLGGAFDPPHIVHVTLAEAACAQLNLDALHVIPTGDAWHKTRTLTIAAHRVAMTRLAFANLPQAVIDTREITRSGPTYTVDTLRELKAEYPDAQLYLIMGADQARVLTTWRNWEEVVRLAIICVAARAPVTGANGAIRTEFGTDFPPGVEVHRIDMPVSDLSATRIRTQLAAHQSVSPLVFEPVARYIALHHLYSSSLMNTPTAVKKDIQKLQRSIVDGLEDVKAQDIVVFDTEHISSLFERVIIASGTSNRQTKALAASVRDAVREAGFPKPRIEGEANGEWIIVDCAQAVVHIFQPTFRQYYHLEELWGEKPVRLKLGSAKPEVRQAEKPVAKAPAKNAPEPSMRRSSAAKKGVEEAFPSKAALKKAAAKAAPAKKAPAKRTAPKAPAVKTAAKTIVVKAPVRTAAKSAAAKKAAPKKPARKV